MSMREDIFQDCLNAWRNSGGGVPKWAALAERYGYKDGEAIRCAFKRERKKRGVTRDTDGNNDNVAESRKKTVTEDSIHVVCDHTRIKTEQELIEEFNIDMDRWKIDLFEVKILNAWRKDREVEWEVEQGSVLKGHVHDSGKILIEPLHNVRAKFVPKSVQDITESDVQSAIENVLSSKEIVFPKTPKHNSSDLMAEIDLADVHIGSRSWDNRFANMEERFNVVVGRTIAALESLELSQINLAFLGDLFHVDTIHNKTSRHEIRVETNGMTPKEMFQEGLRLTKAFIVELSKLAPVECIYVRGNHDEFALYALLCVLDAYFRDNPDVNFDLGDAPQKILSWGECLIGLEHGDASNKNRFHWLQVIGREFWSYSRFFEIHHAHLHHQEVEEEGGVTRRRVPSIAFNDKWHQDNAFVGSLRSTVTFVWHKTEGLQNQIFSNV